MVGSGIKRGGNARVCQYGRMLESKPYNRQAFCECLKISIGNSSRRQSITEKAARRCPDGVFGGCRFT